MKFLAVSILFFVCSPMLAWDLQLKSRIERDYTDLPQGKTITLWAFAKNSRMFVAKCIQDGNSEKIECYSHDGSGEIKKESSTIFADFARRHWYQENSTTMDASN